MIGDYITAINGIFTDRLKHMEIVTLLKNTGSLIQIQISFPLPPRAPQSAFSVRCKRTAVTLTKDDDSVGLVIRGGAQPMTSKSRPLTITHVRVGGSADRDGLVRVGDRIVAINGVAVITATIETARRLIKESSSKVTLVVEYNITIMESIQNSTGPLQIQIGCGAASDLGLALKQKVVKGKPVIMIDTIYTASIAERCGALHVGDHIQFINGVEVVNMSAAEAEHFLSTRTSSIVELEVLPIGHLMPAKHMGTASHSNASAGLLCNQSYHLEASFYSVFSDEQVPAPSRQNSTIQRKFPLGCGPAVHRPATTSVRSVASSSSNGSRNVVCHEEKMAVCLFANHIGIGILLHSNQLPSETLVSPPFIGVLEHSSSADRCGVLLEGDRVLAINGTDVMDCSLNECRKMLHRSIGKCMLDVAFDVSDEMLSSSGIFQVKLYKKGGSIGIGLEEKPSSGGSVSIRIFDVKKGSPAYRCGAISIGDELLGVDNISVSNVQVDDARQILQNADELVKLRVRKIPQFADGEFVFTLELPKQNNSIGLTIHGDEQLNQPITIAKITQGGIAERTGALQVGDRLLSINGKSLKGQPISFAIQQLQCGEVISLKICREKDTSGLKGQTNFKPPDQHSGRSKDSALDSWDSEVSPLSHREADIRNLRKRSAPHPNMGNDWSTMIEELKNFGKMITPHPAESAHHTSSTSSPHSDYPQITPSPEISSSCASTNPDLLTVCMQRQEHETFGFGLSDALYSSYEGCYIKAVGKNSPSDKAGLQKYDKLVKINGVNVDNHSSNDIVPIIERAGTKLDLVVIRNTQEIGSTHSSSVVSSLHSSTDSIKHSQ